MTTDSIRQTVRMGVPIRIPHLESGFGTEIIKAAEQASEGVFKTPIVFNTGDGKWYLKSFRKLHPYTDSMQIAGEATNDPNSDHTVAVTIDLDLRQVSRTGTITPYV